MAKTAVQKAAETHLVRTLQECSIAFDIPTVTIENITSLLTPVDKTAITGEEIKIGDGGGRLSFLIVVCILQNALFLLIQLHSRSF